LLKYRKRTACIMQDLRGEYRENIVPGTPASGGLESDKLINQSWHSQ